MQFSSVFLVKSSLYTPITHKKKGGARWASLRALYRYLLLQTSVSFVSSSLTTGISLSLLSLSDILLGPGLIQGTNVELREENPKTSPENLINTFCGAP